MPTKYPDRELKKTTIRLFEDDLEILQQVYPATGYNKVIRALVAKHVRKIRNIAGQGAVEDGTLLTAEDLNL